MLALTNRRAFDNRKNVGFLTKKPHFTLFGLLWNRSSLFCFIVLFLGLVLLQLPFTQADPDSNLSWSRGPYTDEGLYTVQVRNALITGHLDLEESDGVIKEPLFAAGVWLVIQGFGDSMQACRMAVIVLTAVMLALFTAGSGAFSRTVRMALPLGFLGYYVFHYSHLAMAEIPCSLATLTGVWLTYERLSGKSGWTLAMAGFCMFVAYACKIQFAYVALIPMLAFALAGFLQWVSGMPPIRSPWLDFTVSSIIACAFAGLYAAIWILPHQDLFFRVLGTQTSQRSAGLGDMPGLALYNLHEMLQLSRLWPLWLLLPFGLIAAWREWLGSVGNPERRQAWIALMAPVLAWLILELHKLRLSYLPSRYLVSFFIVIALLQAAGLSMLSWRLHERAPLPFRLAIAVAFMLMLVANTAFYMKAWQERTYAIRNAQRDFAADSQWRGKVVMGAWAPTLFWDSGAITRPVWKEYFNDNDTLARHHPVALVAEVDQADSKGAWTAAGINPEAFASRIIRLRIGRWNVRVYALGAPSGETPLPPSRL